MTRWFRCKNCGKRLKLYRVILGWLHLELFGQFCDEDCFISYTVDTVMLVAILPILGQVVRLCEIGMDYTVEKIKKRITELSNCGEQL